MINFAQFARKRPKDGERKKPQFMEHAAPAGGAANQVDEDLPICLPQSPGSHDASLVVKVDEIGDLGNEAVVDTHSSVETYATEKRIPIACQVDLKGHQKAISCISIEPAGNRVVTGSLDYCVKIYDFGGMDSRHRAFKSIGSSGKSLRGGYCAQHIR